MAQSALWLLTTLVLVGATPAIAADVTMIRPAPAVVEELPPVVADGSLVRSGPLRPPPQIRYGCQRIWRCDTTICEWRRGCWGVYGYVEGPYYTSVFARRQWEAHGLSVTSHYKRRRHKK